MDEEVLIRSVNKKAFELGLEIISLDNTHFKCNGYKVIDNELYLSRYSKECEKFPYEFNLKQTIDFAWGWYENNKPTNNEPCTDGSTAIAFELSTERTGVGSKDWGMFCSVKPIWFIYGK